MFGKSNSAQSPRCVVFERHPQWGPLLRREIGDRVTQVRSMDECRKLLDTSPGCIFVLQPSSKSMAAVLDFVVQGSIRGSGSRFIVVTDQHDVSTNRSWLESGACCVVTSVRSFEDVARLVRRHEEQASQFTSS